MLRCTVALILLSCGFCPAVFAQFEHLSLEHGLSQTTVTCILQDRKGYLWFGTSDGLNKYDGYNFTVYRNNSQIAHSLSDDNISAIAEDKSGAIWIGTTKGVLNRFDRTRERFTRYTLPVPTGSAGAAENESAELPFIFSFFTDQTITALHVDSNPDGHDLWIGTWRNGLYKINLLRLEETVSPGRGFAAGAVVHYQHHPANPKSLSDNRIRAICRDHQGRLWIGTFGGGLNRFDDATASFQPFKHDPADPNSLSDDHVLAIYGERPGELWIGTLGGGLNKLVPATSVPLSGQPALSSLKFARSNFDQRQNNIACGFRFIRYRHDPANAFSLSDNDVSVVFADRYQTLWVGTFGGGLNQFDPVTEHFTHFRRDRFNPNSFRANDVLSIYEDKSGIVWIGSQLGVGASKYDRRQEKFVHYKNDPSNPHSLSDDVVWSILAMPGRDDVVWIGTYHGGLNRFDRKTPAGAAGRFTAFRHDPSDPRSLSQNHIRAICEDEAGALWVGTFSEGLNKFVPELAEKSKRGVARFTRYKYDPANPYSLSHNHVRALHKDKSGTLWVGTIGGGLNRFEKSSGRFIRYQHHPANPSSLSDDRVYAIYEDRAETLWIGTFGGGLNKVFIPNPGGAAENFDGLYFVSYKNDAADSASLSDNRIMAICEDRDGALWIGTFGGGLNRFDRATGKFKRFGMHNGLPSDVIYGIMEDASGNLWISSNYGLSRFNPRTLACKTYDERDGLQSKEFSGGAFAQSRDGAMFFGGINGLNSFFPDSVKENLFVPPIMITSFKKFDQVAGREMEKIELAHTDNFFSFEFSALDYADPSKNQYAYFLEGFDRSWIFSGTRHTVSYTNLDPGRYTFRVKGANNDGIWNEAGAAVRITIHPPFWQTWWFRALALGLLAAAIFMLHEYRVRQKIRQMLEIERVRKTENENLRKQVADDFHDEFGQKLTNIALFAEIIRRNLNGAAPQTAGHLNKINDAATSLSDGMRDFIWTLDRNKDSFYNVATRLKDCGELLFAKTKIGFEMTDLSPDWENIALSMDWKRHLIQIFKEGMKNAAKHAACSNVALDMACTAQRVTIRLADDGKGFENNDAEYGAGLRYIKKRAGKIGGDLKIISQPGRGTMIQFTGRISGNADTPQIKAAIKN
jgi:ligand-binding sensor domain-containing protein/signal transduction histidine kinase